ncbi:MAG: hypothetical protein WDN72_00130 [Alphaproteobacteria bacterium]
MDSFPLAWLLPLVLLGAAALLATSAAPLLRREATLAAIASALAGLVAGLLLQVNDAQKLLWMLAGLLIALPLLDRARLRALPVAGLLSGWAGLCALQYASMHWGMPGASVLPALLVAMLGASFAGSLWLGLHPARFTARGEARLPESPPLPLFIGWGLLAIVLATLSAALREEPISLHGWLAPAIAALVVLFAAHRQADALARIGQALAAGIVIKSAGGLTMEGAALAGVAAAVCVLRGEALAIAIRLDDPPRALGALLLPAMVAIVAPGFADLSHLGDQLQYLGIALGLGVALGLTVWPLAMLLPGLKRVE